MDKLPYQIICSMWTSIGDADYSFTIEPPKYFAKYTHFKLKLKQCSYYFATEEISRDVWLCSDNVTYNRIILNQTDYYIQYYLFNLTSVSKSNSRNCSHIMPYKDKIRFWIRDETNYKCNGIHVLLVFELEPYEI
ncbi:MAG: hypothetical protein SOZ95_03460 [Bacilli bacterium]|nr:hypothetical protein [Bacilli bacterium]